MESPNEKVLIRSGRGELISVITEFEEIFWESPIKITVEVFYLERPLFTSIFRKKSPEQEPKCVCDVTAVVPTGKVIEKRLCRDHTATLYWEEYLDKEDGETRLGSMYRLLGEVFFTEEGIAEVYLPVAGLDPLVELGELVMVGKVKPGEEKEFISQ